MQMDIWYDTIIQELSDGHLSELLEDAVPTLEPEPPADEEDAEPGDGVPTGSRFSPLARFTRWCVDAPRMLERLMAATFRRPGAEPRSSRSRCAARSAHPVHE